MPAPGRVRPGVGAQRDTPSSALQDPGPRALGDTTSTATQRRSLSKPLSCGHKQKEICLLHPDPAGSSRAVSGAQGGVPGVSWAGVGLMVPGDPFQPRAFCDFVILRGQMWLGGTGVVPAQFGHRCGNIFFHGWRPSAHSQHPIIVTPVLFFMLKKLI